MHDLWHALTTIYGCPRELIVSGATIQCIDNLLYKNADIWNRLLITIGVYENEILAKLDEVELNKVNDIIKSFNADHSLESLKECILGRNFSFNFSGLANNNGLYLYGFVFPKKFIVTMARPTSISISECKFLGGISINNCLINEGFYFCYNTVCEFANFHENEISGDIFICSSVYAGTASFSDTKFESYFFFEENVFNEDVLFYNSDISDPMLLTGSIFSEVSFNNCHFKNIIDFSGVIFNDVPEFYGAILHEGISLSDVTWPKSPLNKITAQKSCAAYERLKLEMDRLKKHEDEMFFFAKELECRRVMAGFWKGLPIALYGLLSGYGRSYFRPLNGLLLTIAAGTVAWAGHFGEAKFWKALGFSIAHTFAIFNFRKELLDPDDLKHLSYLLTVVSGTQSVLGILFIFLLGLALRNHMRMK